MLVLGNFGVVCYVYWVWQHARRLCLRVCWIFFGRGPWPYSFRFLWQNVSCLDVIRYPNPCGDPIVGINRLSFVLFLGSLFVVTTCRGTEPIDIGSRLEPFVDDFLIDTIAGAKLTLHQPLLREVVIRHDAPWEGNVSWTHSVIQDGPIYRMYYRGAHADINNDATARSFLCYAESNDGIHWKKPEVGLVDFKESKKNNIIWSRAESAKLWNIPDSVGLWNMLISINCGVFKDANPDCPPDARYKMLGGHCNSGSCAFKSADGIHFTAMSQGPVISSTLGNQFDSNTSVFWDSVGNRYLSFHRAGRLDYNMRETVMCSSKDFLHWSDPVFLEYPGAPTEQLYTNSIVAYARAPHILMGFPKRFMEGRKAVDLCPLDDGISDGVFMTSRDGLHFRRWPEAFLRPGLQPECWVNRNNFIANGMVVTKSDLVGAPDELSIYAIEGYYSANNTCRLRRHTIRMDGFVSMQAPLSGGEFVTKPLVFAGKTLVMNYSTSAAGSVSVELQTPHGKPIDGFSLADCGEIYGDQLDRTVAWKDKNDVSKLAGTPVRLHFVLKDADLYSIQFRP